MHFLLNPVPDDGYKDGILATAKSYEHGFKRYSIDILQFRMMPNGPGGNP